MFDKDFFIQDVTVRDIKINAVEEEKTTTKNIQ